MSEMDKGLTEGDVGEVVDNTVNDDRWTEIARWLEQMEGQISAAGSPPAEIESIDTPASLDEVIGPSHETVWERLTPQTEVNISVVDQNRWLREFMFAEAVDTKVWDTNVRLVAESPDLPRRNGWTSFPVVLTLGTWDTRRDEFVARDITLMDDEESLKGTIKTVRWRAPVSSDKATPGSKLYTWTEDAMYCSNRSDGRATMMFSSCALTPNKRDARHSACAYRRSAAKCGDPSDFEGWDWRLRDAERDLSVFAICQLQPVGLSQGQVAHEEPREECEPSE